MPAFVLPFSVQDGCVYVYDVVSGAMVRRLEGHTAAVRDVSWHPTQPLLASSSWDGTFILWKPHGASPGRRDSDGDLEDVDDSGKATAYMPVAGEAVDDDDEDDDDDYDDDSEMY